MKMKNLPETRMPAMIDRTVLVPIEDTEVMNSVEALPRTMEESAVIHVKLKRMKGLKNTHIESFVRPDVIFKALATLKKMGNKHYKNVLTKCLYCPLVFKDDDDISAHDKECFEKTKLESSSLDVEQDLEVDEEGQSTKTSKDATNDESNGTSNITKYQIINDTSCIVLNHPEVNIIVNDSDVPKKVKIKDSIAGKDVILAPGEGVLPSNIMRESNFDEKGFPCLHPSGKYGLHFNRKYEITKQMYFQTRLCHYTGLFANNNDYVFMCQQYVERSQLESNIDITTLKGVVTNAADGTKMMKLTDAFSVFQKIRGTPKYWQSKRNNTSYYCLVPLTQNL